MRARAFVLVLAAAPGVTVAQPTLTGTFTPGTREIFNLELSSVPVGSVPKTLKPIDPKSKLAVAMKDGVPMLKAVEPSEFRVDLGESLPEIFTLEFDITPKACCNPEDLAFEGTKIGTRSAVSAHIEWHPATLVVVGGGENFQIPMPADLSATLPSALTHIAVSLDGGTISMFTNGRLLYTLKDRKFVRGRMLYVFLGGQDADDYAVYLSRLRVAAGGGVAAVGGTSGAGAPFAVTVTPGVTAPVVTWTAAPNATGYIVSRSKIDDLNCCNVTSGRTYTATSPWQDQPLPMSGTYLYKVTANTPTGLVIAEAQFGFRMPGDNTALGTSAVTAVLVQPTTTGTITPTTNTGTVVTERAPTTPSSAPTILSSGPAPTNLTAGGVPGFLTLVQLKWDAVAGATHYKINRALAGTTTWTSLVTEPFPTEPTFGAGVPDPTKTYTYQVIAYQADGRFGAATIDWHPLAYEPTNFTATPIGPGQVRLEWDNLPVRFDPMFGAANDGSFFLSGPGTGTGLTVVASSTSATERNSYTLTGVPAGSQTWTLTVDWARWGIITPNTSWTKATATVPAVAADPVPRYRLVALGFRALQQSKDIDDARDGHGDEVYFSAMVNRTQSTGVPLPVTKRANLTMVMTRSHGDEAVSVPYGRIKAGTASATGGIKSGDAVPANLDPAAPTGPLQTLTFPIVVWEGELGENDVVVVHPVLWEDDVNPVVQALWAKALVDAAASGYVNEPVPYDGYISSGVIPHHTAERIYEMNAASRSAAPGMDVISNGLEPDLRMRRVPGNEICTCTIVAFNLTRRPCEAHGVDRPIGLEANANGGMSEAWLERLIFLSRASVQAALTGVQYAPYAAWPRGTFSLKLRDQVSSKPLDIEAIASYDLFFRIERVR